MMTHKEYMEQNSIVENTFDLHHSYYSQFVTGRIKVVVKNRVDIAALAKDYNAGDKHLNNRYSCTKVWDHIMSVTHADIYRKLQEAGQCNSIATQVCIVKAAARILIEEYNNEAV